MLCSAAWNNNPPTVEGIRALPTPRGAVRESSGVSASCCNALSICKLYRCSSVANSPPVALPLPSPPPDARPSPANSSSCPGPRASPLAYVSNRSNTPARCCKWNPGDATPPGRSHNLASGNPSIRALTSALDCSRAWATGCSRAGIPAAGPRSQYSGLDGRCIKRTQ